MSSNEVRYKKIFQPCLNVREGNSTSPMVNNTNVITFCVLICKTTYGFTQRDNVS